MKVTKELKTLIRSRIEEKVRKEDLDAREKQAELVKKLNEQILASKEYAALEEAKDALGDMIVELAEKNNVATFYEKREDARRRRGVDYRDFVRAKTLPVGRAEAEIARIITRIEYGTDYSDLSSVLAEYGIEL